MTDLFFFNSHNSLVVLYRLPFFFFFLKTYPLPLCRMFFPRGRLVLFVSLRLNRQGFRYFA